MRTWTALLLLALIVAACVPAPSTPGLNPAEEGLATQLAAYHIAQPTYTPLPTYTPYPTPVPQATVDDCNVDAVGAWVERMTPLVQKHRNAIETVTNDPIAYANSQTVLRFRGYAAETRQTNPPSCAQEVVSEWANALDDVAESLNQASMGNYQTAADYIDKALVHEHATTKALNALSARFGLPSANGS